MTLYLGINGGEDALGLSDIAVNRLLASGLANYSWPSLTLPPSGASGSKQQMSKDCSGKMNLVLKICQAEVGCVGPLLQHNTTTTLLRANDEKDFGINGIYH